MKIVNLLGGLGNQMFEYAMYLALKHAHPEEVIKVCTRCFKGYKLHNGIELYRIFNIQAEEASLRELAKVAYPFFNYRSWQVMNHWLPNKKTMVKGITQIPFDRNNIDRGDSMFYDGYWQNENNFKHIRETILNAYKFSAFEDDQNIEVANLIGGCNAVSCHVRRGDYINNPILHTASLDYYQQAIQYIKQNGQIDMIVVFSDDIPWCKEYIEDIAGDIKTIYVDWNKGKESYRDMQLMSLCKHNIIANSSFSWWGAWLNQNEDKIVVAPELWLKYPIVNDPICNDWIRIKG